MRGSANGTFEVTPRSRRRGIAAVSLVIFGLAACTSSSESDGGAATPEVASPSSAPSPTEAVEECPSAPENPPAAKGRASVDGASLPLRDEWTMRGSSAGWVAFGSGTSETQGGNLLRVTCVQSQDGQFAEVPDGVVGWLRQRPDLGARVVEQLAVDGRQGALVIIAERATVWCVAPSEMDCFGSGFALGSKTLPSAYGVFPMTSGVLVVEGFGESEQQIIRNTRSLAMDLGFG